LKADLFGQMFYEIAGDFHNSGYLFVNTGIIECVFKLVALAGSAHIQAKLEADQISIAHYAFLFVYAMKGKKFHFVQ
jgi:hypothetical protein